MTRLLMLCLYFLPLFAYSDVWQCGDIYTNIQAGENCEEVKSSLSCGKDGNKYLTPVKDPHKAKVDNCKVNEESQSPFVNLKKLELQKADQEKNKELAKKNQAEKKGFQKVNSVKDPSQQMQIGKLPPIANEIIGKYLDIWGSYDQLLD